MYTGQPTGYPGTAAAPSPETHSQEVNDTRLDFEPTDAQRCELLEALSNPPPHVDQAGPPFHPSPHLEFQNRRLLLQLLTDTPPDGARLIQHSDSAARIRTWLHPLVPGYLAIVLRQDPQKAYREICGLLIARTGTRHTQNDALVLRQVIATATSISLTARHAAGAAARPDVQDIPLALARPPPERGTTGEAEEADRSDEEGKRSPPPELVWDPTPPDDEPDDAPPELVWGPMPSDDEPDDAPPTAKPDLTGTPTPSHLAPAESLGNPSHPNRGAVKYYHGPPAPPIQWIGQPVPPQPTASRTRH